MDAVSIVSMRYRTDIIQETTMDRYHYDQLVLGIQMLVHTTDTETISHMLVQCEIEIDEWPQTRDFEEQMAIFGATEDHRDLRTICSEFGFSDPQAIDHVAIARTKDRIFMVLQTHEHNTTEVSVYIYKTDRPTNEVPHGWFCGALDVRGTM